MFPGVDAASGVDGGSGDDSDTSTDTVLLDDFFAARGAVGELALGFSLLPAGFLFRSSGVTFL